MLGGLTLTRWANSLDTLVRCGTTLAHGIVNILCFADVCNHFHVCFDSTKEWAFLVKKPDGTTKRFVQLKVGLYFHDTTDRDTPTMCDNTPETSFLTMVADNKSRYTDHMYVQASLAQKLQAMIRYPSTHDFLHIVDKHLLPNCPITQADILAAEDIFGPDVHSLKGKTAWWTEPHIASSVTPMPMDILSLYQSVTLCVDIMFMNKLPFLVTISHHLKFGTAELLLNCQEDMAGKTLTDVMCIYGSRGFLVQMVHAESKFEALCAPLASAGSGLNVCANDEHIPEVERFIRTLKERTCCMYHSVPFQRFPALMLKVMISTSIIWLNMFPAHNGISDTLSPRMLMTGYDLDYNKNCHLQFGSYVQMHEEHDNSMHSHTTGAIALHPTRNHQGGYYFMSLSTGHHLIHNHWTELPLPQDVIDHVNTLGHHSNVATDLTFAWCDGSPIIDLDSPNDDPYDSDYVPLDDEADYDDNLSYLSDGDLTTTGVEDDNNDNENDNNDNENENHNNNNNNNENDDNSDDDDNSNNDDNNDN